MTAGDYDVIVVGARVAGAATAMLLARQGLSVLALDRARFPSDTLSTHQVQLPGVALLHRWGLLDRLHAAATPAVRDLSLSLTEQRGRQPTVVHASLPTFDGVDTLYSPRRTVLDGMLVSAAREAGAQVREGYAVKQLLWHHGRVVGVVGAGRDGTAGVERARMVVGADGKHSLVARDVGAAWYRRHPTATFASYTYWSGLGLTSGEMYHRPGRAVAAFPTNDGLAMVLAMAPAAEFASARRDPLAHYEETLSGCGDLLDRLRAGTQAERLRTTPDLPQHFRTAYGPGWALVGDAGLVLDPITAQGISNALRGAHLLSEVVATNLATGHAVDHDLTRYGRGRDAAVVGMDSLTASLATLGTPGLLRRRLMRAVAARPAESQRFLGMFAGAEPVRSYFAWSHVLRLLAAR